MAYALVVEETREAVALAPQGIKDKLILRRADVVGVQPEPQLLYDEQRGSDAQKEGGGRSSQCGAGGGCLAHGLRA